MSEKQLPNVIKLNSDQWQHVERNNDLTIYWPWQLANQILPSEVVQAIRKKGRFEEKVSLVLDRALSPKTTLASTVDSVTARANIVRCGAGKWLSGTFRTRDFKPKGYLLSPAIKSWPHQPSDYLIPALPHAEFLWQKLFRHSVSELQGAIVIAGATGCGKSDFATELVKLLMHKLVDNTRHDAKKRLPHLVTFEDPIEGWTITANKKNGTPGNKKGENPGAIDLTEPKKCMPYGMCITARQKPQDVCSLRDALLDARRQTPKCFYVGELREDRDWRDVLDFAGSGHLILVTTHAASTQEAMSRMLAACRARTPAQRRQWAGFVKGILHLVMPEIERTRNRKPERVVLPSLWHGTGAALNGLVATGLSSVVPNNNYVLSRSQYFDALIEKWKQPNASKLWAHECPDKADQNTIREYAKSLDLSEIMQK